MTSITKSSAGNVKIRKLLPNEKPPFKTVNEARSLLSSVFNEGYIAGMYAAQVEQRLKDEQGFPFYLNVMGELHDKARDRMLKQRVVVEYV